MSKALELAKECGAIFDRVLGNSAFTPVELETFYRRSQAQALRDAAEYCTSGYAPDVLNAMADELEAGK